MVAHPLLTLSPSASSGSVQGYTPAQIRQAYGFDLIQYGSSAIQGDGSGQTIAIVDAYNDPNIVKDLSTFDQQFGLSAPPSITAVSQTGSTTALPKSDAGWSTEISLDVEWAHAIAPAAKILLVEAKTASLSSLLSAVDYARQASGVSVVSMSWGAGEFSGQSSLDGHFKAPAGHQGVTFVGASGDLGSLWGPSWPAISSNVLAVGGTALSLQNSAGTYGIETGWGGSTGGVSWYSAEPSYQNIVQTSGARTSPDVSFNADPNTGFAVYDSVAFQKQRGWQVYGGTSAGTPQWAALIAIADQGRALNNMGTLDGGSETLPALYSAYKSASTYNATFHDPMFGRTSYFIGAQPGYDLVTGLGSPQANQVVRLLGAGSGKVTARVTTVRSISRRAARTRARPLVAAATAAPTVTPPARDATFSTVQIPPIEAQVFAAERASTAVVTPAAGKPVTPISFGDEIASRYGGGAEPDAPAAALHTSASVAPQTAPANTDASTTRAANASTRSIAPQEPFEARPRISASMVLPDEADDVTALATIEREPDRHAGWKESAALIGTGILVGTYVARDHHKSIAAPR